MEEIMKRWVPVVLIVICVVCAGTAAPKASSAKLIRIQTDRGCQQPADLSAPIAAALKWVETRDKIADPTAVPSYTLTASVFVDASDIGRCLLGTAVLNRITGQIDKFLVDIDTLNILSIEEVRQARLHARGDILSRFSTDLWSFVTALDPNKSKRVMIWFKTLPGEDITSRQLRAFDTLVQGWTLSEIQLCKPKT